MLSVEAAKTLGALDVTDDLAAVLEAVDVILGPSADVGVVIASIVASDATERSEAELWKGTR